MKLFVVILLLFSNSVFSQFGKNEIYKYSDKNSLIFDYSTLSSTFLTNKHFGLSESNEDEINKIYKTLNVFQFAPNNIIGEFVLNDTIKFDKKISFSDANFAIKSFLSNSINLNIKENKYGYYLFNVILRHKYYSDDIFRVSLKVRDGYIILSTNTLLYFNTYYQLIPKNIAYNDKSEAFKYEKAEDGSSKQIFIDKIAERQLYFYSILYETRERLEYQINQYLLDVIKIQNLYLILNFYNI